MKSRVALAPFLAVSASFAQQRTAILDAAQCVVDPRHHFETLLDLNGDGFMDAVTLNISSGGIGCSALLNDGTGRFTGWSGFSSSGSYSSQTQAHIERCDVNHDAADDFYMTVPSAGRIFVFAVTMGGGFTYVYQLGYTGAFTAAKMADFDGDGYIDRARVWSNTLSLDRLVPNGSGGYTATTTSVTLGFNPQTMLLLDCDGDGALDIYVHGNTEAAFVPVVGGVLQAPIPFTHGVSSPMPMPILGDVDGDGDEDIAIFDMTGYRIYRRTGPASWFLEPYRIGGPAAKFADVDGDGDLDGICCGGGGSYDYYFDQPSTFRISLNDGTGNFAPAFSFPGSGSMEIAGAADLDHDGDIDLVAGNCVYWGRGPLTHSPITAIPSGAQSERSLCDFDGDGDVDFTPGIGVFQRHLGDGSSHDFQAKTPAPPVGYTFEGPGISADWDGDGDPDLLVRMKSGNLVISMRLLLNEGGGTYVDGGDAFPGDVFPGGVVGVQPDSAFVHDLDLDGDLDLITFVRTSVSSPNGRTKTWLNDGHGHFTFAWEYTNGWPVGFGRLVGDGWPDAVMVTNGQGEGRVMPGNGTGSFTSAGALSLYFGTSVGAVSVAIADFDQDGDDDLVGAFQFGGYGWYSGKGYFIPNVNGALSLADKVTLDDLDNEQSGSSAVPTPRIAVAGDVNGDGLLDAILSCPEHRRAAVSIVLRRSDNTGWMPPVRQVVYAASGSGTSGVLAYPGAAIDIDGDGDVDYVTDSIFSNVRESMPDSGKRRQGTVGWADANGIVPTLGATGPFRVGESAEILLTGAPGGASGLLVVSYAADPTPFSGGPMHAATREHIVAQIAFTTSGTPGTPACGRWSLPYIVPGYVAGRTKNYVAVIHDQNGGEVRSNALSITYGP